MAYSAKKEWSNLYLNMDIAYPAEGVIRILLGNFPHLTKMPKPKKNQKILDVGCGDGRHFPLFQKIGLKGYGSEISEEIVAKLKRKLTLNKIKFESIDEGACENLPYKDNYFDYLLTWNSCYYMSLNNNLNFNLHVKEMARTLKVNGWIICSIPKKSSFVFKGSKELKIGYRELKKDYWGTRGGEIMRFFDSAEEIKSEFKPFYKNFIFAEVDMKWFGLNYDWHIFVAQKK